MGHAILCAGGDGSDYPAAPGQQIGALLKDPARRPLRAAMEHLCKIMNQGACLTLHSFEDGPPPGEPASHV